MSNRFGISDDVIEAVRKVLAGEKMDPVGKADADIDNDGDVDKSDSYLHNRRKAISKAMKEEVELGEAKKDAYHKEMLKALGKSKLPKEHQYTSAVASNGDFVVYDGGKRIVGRLKKGEHSIKEGVDLDEAKMSASQIAALKKAYEPMRGKKISMDSGNKLRSIMDKIDDDKQALIRLVKADIPFVSALAVTRLISKHDMKGAEINKLKEEVDLDEAVKLGTKVKIHAPGKSYHDKEGRVGEIRHGLYKGAPKTYTVDHEGGSIQLDKKNIRVAKEEVEQATEEVKKTAPFSKPYKKVGDRKDEYGNVVKNAAKYLAKKAMKKQMAKEDIEQTDEGASGGLKTFKKKDEVDVKPKMAEASELPKKVIMKGHEIAKKLIKMKSKVDEPYAVGMDTAKKKYGID